MGHNESRRMWVEVVVTYLKVLSLHLNEGTDENHNNLSQKCWCLARDYSCRLTGSWPEVSRN
jgi:hypothetical protein